MKPKHSSYTKNILLPCLFYSAITGVCTGILIFLFKAAASFVIARSELLYDFVRGNPVRIPLLLLGMTAVGILSAVLLHFIPDARGGGIPTAIAILRGLIPFHWIKSIVFVFLSAMLTYFGGVPLGNEGPSVQMGTAVGRGTVSLFAKKQPAWDRYIMTGGACAGFAVATGSPITGILFAVEEAHHRISPMILMSAALSTLFGVSTAQMLCESTGISFAPFHFHTDVVLPLQYLWTAILIGIVTGLAAAGFTKMYQKIRQFLQKTLQKIPSGVKIAAIFFFSAYMGIASASCIGSGHHLIDELMDVGQAVSVLVIVGVVRALLLLFATNASITGGLFIPTLTLGAILGALTGKAMIILGVLPEEYYPVMVIAGVAAFLSASSRIPLIALVFSAEGLGGITNIVPIAVAVIVSFLVIEALGITAFTDTVVESKSHIAHHGQTPYLAEAELTVVPGAFACGKEVRDLFLPPTCVILYVQREEDTQMPAATITEGDILHLHFKTYDPDSTMEQLERLFGRQEGAAYSKITFWKENMIVPH